jgi:acyl dehydratase
MSQRVSAERRYRGTHPLSEARVGDELGTFDVTITEAMVERNAWANDDYHPWYMEGSPFGGRLVSPVHLSLYDGPELFYGYYAYPSEGSLFARQELEYLKPVLVGREYRMSGRIEDITERRGRTFLRMAVSVVDRQSGDEVMRMAKLIAWPVKARE